MFIRLATALCVVLFASGCASTICKKAEDIVSVRVADVVAEKLACENEFAVQMSVLETVRGFGVCEKKNNAVELIEKANGRIEGPVADLLCPAVATTLVSGIGTRTPPEWKCSVNPSTVPLKGDIERVCRFIPFAPKKVAK